MITDLFNNHIQMSASFHEHVHIYRLIKIKRNNISLEQIVQEGIKVEEKQWLNLFCSGTKHQFITQRWQEKWLAIFTERTICFWHQLINEIKKKQKMETEQCW